jgi:hypothetical protein
MGKFFPTPRWKLLLLSVACFLSGWIYHLIAIVWGGKMTGEFFFGHYLKEHYSFIDLPALFRSELRMVFEADNLLFFWALSIAVPWVSYLCRKKEEKRQDIFLRAA